MPGTTSPDDIVYPLPTDPIAPLNAVFQDMAESVQDALDEKIYLPSTPANKDILVFDGTNWVSRSQAAAGAIPTFADAAARTAAISSPTEGMTSYLDDLNRIEVYDGSAWGAVGGILQVVSTTKTDTFTSTSTTFADVTGLSATITPSSISSKIYVVASITGNGTAGTTIMHLRLTRAATAIFVGDAAGSRVQSGVSILDTETSASSSSVISGLDSPATTSATTYAVQVRNQGTGTVYINRSSSDGNAVSAGRTVSTITLLEVAG